MLAALIAGLLIGLGVATGQETGHPVEPAAAPVKVPDGFVALPNPDSPVQLRLYTNGTLANTIEIQAYGETLVKAPRRCGRPRESSLDDAPLHNLLVNGKGPTPASSNGLTIVDQTAGPGWQYIALDARAAYATLVSQYRRGVLFVEPDLFVVHDHIVAPEPAQVEMLLHPPASAHVDAAWGDLRLETARSGLRVHTPGLRAKPRNWERIQSPADALLPGTATMRLRAPIEAAQIDLLTVFAVHRAGERQELAFRLLEGDNAVGARIHRDGLPTLVAFKLEPTPHRASLTTFAFTDPVAVDVFKPRRKGR